MDESNDQKYSKVNLFKENVIRRTWGKDVEGHGENEAGRESIRSVWGQGLGMESQAILPV